MTAAAAREALADELLASEPVAAAVALEPLPADQIAPLLGARAAGTGARVLDGMMPERAAAVLARLGTGGAPLLAEMSPPQAAAALHWLEPDAREALLAAAPAALGRELRDLMAYPPETAGSLMDPRPLVVRRGDSAGEARARLAAVDRPVYRILVVDDDHRLVGGVPIQALAVAPDGARAGDLARPAGEALDAFTPREEVAALLARTGLPSIPVVDAAGRLVGVLRYRTLLGIAEQEAAADMQQMVGASRDERALSPVWFAVRKRLPWLNINLVTAFLAAAVVGLFENTIAQITSLAVLMPVVAGQSGNSGSQALAVTMRGLAVREIHSGHWAHVAAKELAVGVINGLAIAVVTGLGVWLWSGSVALAAVISIAMVISMGIIGATGASIPIVLKRFGQDPATASSIILTTVSDVVGFSSFLGLATLLADLLV